MNNSNFFQSTPKKDENTGSWLSPNNSQMNSQPNMPFGTGNTNMPFGQTSTNMPFGTSNTNTFGSTNMPFGQASTNTFGSGNTNTFGQASTTNAFGQPQTSSIFGENNPGLFGSSQSTPPTLKTFGSITSTPFSGFNSTPSSTPTTFGSTPTAFSSTPTAFSSNVIPFGNQSNNTFGSASNATPAFGSAPTFQSFNPTANNTFGSNTFGSNTFGTPSTSVFGAPNSFTNNSVNSTPSFGGSSWSSGLGNTTTSNNPAWGLLNKGSKAATYSSTRVTEDNGIFADIQDMCAMKEYVNKPIEEIRKEDYEMSLCPPKPMAGVSPFISVGNSTNNSFNTTPFNSSNTFSQQSNMFKPTTGLFPNNSTNSPFSLTGSVQNITPQNNSNPNMFNLGFSSTTSPFGTANTQPANPSLFSGNTLPSTTQSASPFATFNSLAMNNQMGATNQLGTPNIVGNAFNPLATLNNQIGTGNNSPFGSTNGNPFGAATNAPFGTTSNNPFGTTSNNSFGASNNNMIGTANNSMIGTSNTTPAASNNLFGSAVNQPSSNSLFGSANQTASNNPFGSVNQNTSSSLFGNKPADNTAFNSTMFKPSNLNPFQSSSFDQKQSSILNNMSNSNSMSQGMSNLSSGLNSFSSNNQFASQPNTNDPYGLKDIKFDKFEQPKPSIRIRLPSPIFQCKKDCSIVDLKIRPPRKVSKNSFYTIPDLKDLKSSQSISNLIIGFEGKGKIEFLEPVTISTIEDIEKRVLFRNESVEINYPIGTGLNRKARVFVEGLYPMCRTTNEIIKGKSETFPQKGIQERFIYQLKNNPSKKFVDYNVDSGIYVYEVNHF